MPKPSSKGVWFIKVTLAETGEEQYWCGKHNDHTYHDLLNKFTTDPRRITFLDTRDHALRRARFYQNSPLFSSVEPTQELPALRDLRRAQTAVPPQPIKESRNLYIVGTDTESQEQLWFNTRKRQFLTDPSMATAYTHEEHAKSVVRLLVKEKNRQPRHVANIRLTNLIPVVSAN